MTREAPWRFASVQKRIKYGISWPQVTNFSLAVPADLNIAVLSITWVLNQSI